MLYKLTDFLLFNRHVIMIEFQKTVLCSTKSSEKSCCKEALMKYFIFETFLNKKLVNVKIVKIIQVEHVGWRFKSQKKFVYRYFNRQYSNYI